MVDPLNIISVIIGLLALALAARYVMTGEVNKEFVTMLGTAIGAVITAYSLRKEKNQIQQSGGEDEIPK